MPWKLISGYCAAYCAGVFLACFDPRWGWFAGVLAIAFSAYALLGPED